jgi:hypothetical protein
MITYLSNRACMLPNLTRLKIDMMAFRDLAIYPSLLIGPSVQRVALTTFRAENEDEFNDSIQNLESVGNICIPSLQEVDLNATLTIDNNHLRALFGRLSQVVRLNADHIVLDAHLLHKLLSLSTLKQLWFTIRGNQIQEFVHICNGKQKGLASRLEDIRIRTMGFRHCPKFLLLITGASLRRFEVIWTTDQPENSASEVNSQDLASLLNEMVEGGYLPLQLTHFDMRLLVAGDLTQISEMIKPLLSLVNLEVVNIALKGRLYIDNFLLQAIGNAWRKIRELHLCDAEYGSIPDITLLNVIELIGKCPCLTNLSIRFNALSTKYQIRDLRAIAPRPVDTSLENFDVLFSPIGQSWQTVAQLLVLAFPHLKNVYCGWLGRDPHNQRKVYKQRWDFVTRDLARIG